jgi:hypothetical protein
MKYTIISLISALLILNSCSNWLDVSPKTEIRETELFSDEEGYKEAMSGIYIDLGKADMYGMKISMFVPEMLAHTWTIPTESKSPAAHYLAAFDYTNSNVESYISSMWSSYYNVIAQINNILTNITTSSVDFKNGNKELIEGECYGLRAFLHLDLMRFFGPVPTNASGSASCIPYVTEMTTDVSKLKSVSYDEVKKDILADLTKAESLLATCDPYITTVDSKDASSSSATVTLADSWQYYRQLHFNYYAVLGTFARYYYWIGDTNKAVEYAKKIIASTDKSGNKIVDLVDENYFASHSNANHNMKLEHLFGVYNSNFADEVFTPYYSNYGHIFTQNSQYVATAFESSLYPDDIRNKGTRYWNESQDANTSSTSYHYYKYSYSGSWYGRYNVPCMRLSEMYLIIFEDDSIDDMMPYFKTWRLSRGLDSSIDETLTTSSAVLQRVEKEWRKEFFGEGQMFFFYKQHGYASFNWPTTITLPSLNSYVIPIPQSQTIYE